MDFKSNLRPDAGILVFNLQGEETLRLFRRNHRIKLQLALFYHIDVFQGLLPAAFFKISQRFFHLAAVAGFIPQALRNITDHRVIDFIVFPDQSAVAESGGYSQFSGQLLQ